MTSPHVTKNSGNNEWYTPSVFIEAARSTMGSIDIDPCSCAVAQSNVKATTYYTESTNGLDKNWVGNVWMNPPYSSKLIQEFTQKLLSELSNGNTKNACVLVNNSTETKWGYTLLSNCNSVCFIKGRIKFLDSTGVPKNTPLQGQMVIYFGNDIHKFKESYSHLGKVMTN